MSATAAAAASAPPRDRRPRPSVWDPRSPSTLLLASAAGGGGGDAGTADAGSRPSLSLEAFLSDDGVGCNADETSALIRMLDSRDGCGGGDGGDERTLSREYRGALRDCMAGWEDRILEAEGGGEGGGGGGAAEEEEPSSSSSDADNLELLKVASAILHLSEVYLLPPRRSASSTLYGRGGSGGGGAADGGSVLLLPGSVTADTVRYLRLNHMPDVYDAVGTGASDVARMIESDQPEHYGGGAPFWSLVEAYVVRGCLRDAWAVLTHHSAVRRASSAAAAAAEEGGGGGDGGGTMLMDDPVVMEDCEAFGTLRDLMLNAPLPGGLSDVDDAGLGDEDEEEGGGGGGEEEGTAYRLWDDGAGGGSSRAGGVEYGDDDSMPGTYQPRAAMARHRAWSAAVGRAAAGPGPVLGLTRRIPRLRRVLAILRGRFDEATGGGGGGGDAAGGPLFRSWVEALCAELLYVRPGVRPDDVHVRAAAAMRKFGSAPPDDAGGENTVEEIVLSVMRGDAGKAVLALNGFGGGSGAALPATMTSLLCDLLISAGRIQPSMLPYDLQTELVLSASTSILSSFATQSHPDVGVRLSTRLLLPHATPDNVRVTAALADTLGRHWPRTDAEARDLLALCDGPLRRGSVRVADACDSLSYCRYRHYASDGRPGGAVHWLLRGVQCWTKLPALSPSPSGGEEGDAAAGTRLLDAGLAGSCGRCFVIVCAETARATLSRLAASAPADGGESLVHHHQAAKEVLESIMDGGMSHLVRGHPAVELLRRVFDITGATVAGEGEEAARNIVACLEERTDSDGDGTVKILAPPSMRADLLSVALDVLEREDSEDSDVVDAQADAAFGKAGAAPPGGSAFDVDGIHALMARFAQLTFYESLSPESLRAASAGANDAIKSGENQLPFEGGRMRLALCKGLMRAFVAENSMKKKSRQVAQLTEGRLDAGIGRTVELMLGPSM